MALPTWIYRGNGFDPLCENKFVPQNRSKWVPSALQGADCVICLKPIASAVACCCECFSIHWTGLVAESTLCSFTYVGMFEEQTLTLTSSDRCTLGNTESPNCLWSIDLGGLRFDLGYDTPSPGSATLKVIVETSEGTSTAVYVPQDGFNCTDTMLFVLASGRPCTVSDSGDFPASIVVTPVDC